MKTAQLQNIIHLYISYLDKLINTVTA